MDNDQIDDMIYDLKDLTKRTKEVYDWLVEHLYHEDQTKEKFETILREFKNLTKIYEKDKLINNKNDFFEEKSYQAYNWEKSLVCFVCQRKINDFLSPWYLKWGKKRVICRDCFVGW